MEKYLNLCRFVLENGIIKSDRTNTGTISHFGYQMRFDLNLGYPLLTTKRIHLKSIIHELLWFIKGDTNIKYLVDNDVKIWNDWPYAKYQKSEEYLNETMEEFIEKIKSDPAFAEKWGNLGPIYGKQWRNFGGVDQLSILLEDIKNNPDSRRLILTAWNPQELSLMALPACHCFVQFYVAENKLSCQLYQRSADIFLGVPFNIASYALLTMMIAQVCNLELGEFIHTIGDAHIYSNHVEQINKQLKRIPRSLPKMILNKEVKSLYDFTYQDFTLENYNPHHKIKAEVAV